MELGSSAKGHSDNFGLYTNLGFKFDDETILSSHLRGDSHKYSQENLTYRLNFTKLIDKFTLNIKVYRHRNQTFMYYMAVIPVEVLNQCLQQSLRKALRANLD